MAFLAVLAPLAPYAVALGSSIVTGVATYLMVRPGNQAVSNTTDSRGEVINSVSLAVKGSAADQNSLLVTLIGCLLLLKIIELIIFSIKSYQRKLKKRYTETRAIRMNNNNQNV